MPETPSFLGATGGPGHQENGVLEKKSDGALGWNHYSSTPMLHYSKCLTAFKASKVSSKTIQHFLTCIKDCGSDWEFKFSLSYYVKGDID